MFISKVLLLAATTGFTAVFLRAQKGAVPTYKDWALTVDSVSAIESLLVPGAAGTLQKWKGEREKKGIKVYELEIKIVDYEATAAVPATAIADSKKLAVYDATFKQMAFNAELHPDDLLTETLVAGFAATSSKKSYDNVIFFSASHASGSNLADGALSATNYGDALAKLLAQTDEDGSPLRLGAQPGVKRVLRVGPKLYGTAISIVGVQNTTGGAGNPYYGTAEVELDERLTGATDDYWFLGYRGGTYRPAVYVNREAASLIMDDDPVVVAKTKQVVAMVQARRAMALLFHQAIVGYAG